MQRRKVAQHKTRREEQPSADVLSSCSILQCNCARCTDPSLRLKSDRGPWYKMFSRTVFWHDTPEKMPVDCFVYSPMWWIRLPSIVLKRGWLPPRPSTLLRCVLHVQL